jgi:hypothetical protein
MWIGKIFVDCAAIDDLTQLRCDLSLPSGLAPHLLSGASNALAIACTFFGRPSHLLN